LRERHFRRLRRRSERDLVFAHPLTGHVLDASKLRKRSALHRPALQVRRLRVQPGPAPAGLTSACRGETVTVSANTGLA